MKNKSDAIYWLTLAACCGLAASAIGILTNTVGVYYTPVSSELGVGRGAFAFHASLTGLVTGFFSPVVAKLLKKVNLRILLFTGILFACGATAGMGFARSLPAFYVLGALKGIGVAMFSLMPVTSIIGNWFEAKHGLATGIALSFSGLSGAIFSPILTSLILNIGWANTYLCSALFSALLALPGALFLRYTPGELGLPPYGGALKEPVRPSGEAKASPKADKAGVVGPALLLLVCLAFFNTIVANIAQHFPGISESWGMAAQVGGAMVSAGMIGNIISKLAIGVLSDKVGPYLATETMVLINLASFALFLTLAPASSTVALGAALIYGAVYSVSATGVPLLTRRIFGTERYAAAYSYITMATQIGGALALTVVGLIYDFTGGYLAALIGAVVLNCADLAVLVALSRMEKKA